MTLQKNKGQDAMARSSVGTPEGMSAAGVYVDLVNGLKAQVIHLQRDKTLLLGLALILAACLAVALPLKKVIPYFYEVDSSTGRVIPAGAVAERLNVTDRNIAYFLRVWTARLVTINAGTLREGLPGAYRWVRGGATSELDNWAENVDQTAQRIGKTPGLTREFLAMPLVSFNADRTVAFVDFVWIEKVNGIERERKRKLLTIEFGLAGADAQRSTADMDDNPLGLLITHFTVQDLQASQ